MEALGIVRICEAGWAQVQIFNAIAKCLSLNQQLTAVTEALDAVRTIVNEDLDFISEMNEDLDFISEDWPWFGLLDTITKYLPDNAAFLLSEALSVVPTINEEWKRSHALCILAAYLDNEPVLLSSSCYSAHYQQL